jgi:hypothetical protein
VKNDRQKILQAYTAVSVDMPREAGGLLDSVVPGFANCFHWYHVFISPDGEGFWRLDCIVSRMGWPDTLWIVEAFAHDDPE